MNKERRKAIADLIEDIEKIDFEDIKSRIENIRDEEQEYFDNMPESFQMGDKGQRAEEAISYLEEADSAVDEVLSQIEELIGQLNNASE